ncbi:MAG: DUF488 domain-containing protein [Deltaproteobacteria bacterium]|nr:MAG: DUF488 domain-containing protein [Deltaproteobacteria bacterium]
MRSIQTKRVYEPQEEHDGFRVLVDRVWPRGLTKEQVGADLWLRDVAPSTALRKWFAHDPSNWEEFKRRYFAELDRKPNSVRVLLKRAAERTVTLLYSAHDPKHNQAVALREYLLARSAQHETSVEDNEVK